MKIAAGLEAVAEGYPTARSAYQLARKLGVTTPVLDEVYAMLYQNKNVTEAVYALMSRDLKAENERLNPWPPGSTSSDRNIGRPL